MKSGKVPDRRHLGPVAAAIFACFIALPQLLCANAHAQQPTDADVVAAIKEFARTNDAETWLTLNRLRLTPAFLDAVERISDEAADQANRTRSAGTLRFAQIAKLMAATALLKQGDRPNALRNFIGASDVEFMLANSNDAYEHVLKNALDFAEKAESIGSTDLAFRARVIAGDCAYQASILQGLDDNIRKQRQHDALANLVGAAKFADLKTPPAWLERFLSLSGAVLGDAYNRYAYGGDENERLASLKQLTASFQTLVPPDFSFKLRPDKDWMSDVDFARLLAGLSYEYGDAAIAASRLRYAAAVAQSHGDADQVASSVSQLYEAEKTRLSSPVQLSALRAEVRNAASPLRGGYRSRGGRLWAAARADRLLGQLTRDELSADAAFVDTFGEIESLKARLLLDQLRLRPTPLRAPGDIAAAASLEQELLGFSKCRHSHEDDLFGREMLLLSRMSLATEFTREADELRVTEIEQIYQTEKVGFEGIAAPPSLAAVQGALKADEAIVEYFIPYYEMHPAIDLWVAVITNNRTAAIHVPLDAFLPKSDMIGSVAIDGCPPLDTSPLGNAVATLRVALQSTDEKKADAILRVFHRMLIEPVIKAGFDPVNFRHWIIVPHGTLHYVPFVALTDANGKFLVQQVALSTSPSAAVWLSEQAVQRAPPKTVGGMFAPVLADSNLPPLPASSRETSAILAHFPASERLMFSGSEATNQRLRLIAPKADILHFSTHGDFPELYAVDEHAILLSRDGTDSGRLSAEEIRALDLSNTRLVVLVICNGGLYNVGPSDEPYGLMPAFLVAGATNVLGTLWPLEDEFGRRFVARFYEHLTDAGPAQALRETMTSFIDDGELVRRWSGLVMVGPGRPFSR
jgi:CHAT domain-containing protein